MVDVQTRQLRERDDKNLHQIRPGLIRHPARLQVNRSELGLCVYAELMESGGFGIIRPGREVSGTISFLNKAQQIVSKHTTVE